LEEALPTKREKVRRGKGDQVLRRILCQWEKHICQRKEPLQGKRGKIKEVKEASIKILKKEKSPER